MSDSLNAASSGAVFNSSESQSARAVRLVPLYSGRTHPWTLTRIFTIAAILGCLSIAAIFVDVTVTKFARNHDNIPGDLRRVIELSEIFAHGWGAVFACLLIFTLAPQLRRLIPRLICCSVFPGMVVTGIKMLVVRRRPKFYYPEFADHVNDTWLGFAQPGTVNVDYMTQSFPSAHTATAFGLAIALSWMLPRGRFVFFGFAVLSSIQRIASGAHWLSDIFAGAAVAIVVCGLVFQPWGLGKLLGSLEQRPTGSQRNSVVDH